ncbi:ABC transporter permease [Tunturiibacter lichenicola]|uniref:ABC transporter permease n=1 Tax=Tunturiibacter lichenicola TaxID=2051959 RepID=UPI0021B3BA29|nr:ABC transporter permease [Edaphobacter lichenicola]
MNWFDRIFHRDKLYGDLSEEIRLHLEERKEQLVAAGMSAEEAEREARRAFGNRTLVEERSREVWRWPWIESISGDVRFAMRQLRRSPGFTVAAVVTLALAIGANAVVFSIMNAFLLRPLNVPHAESLFAVFRPDGDSAESYPDYVDLRDRTHSFDGLIAYEVLTVGLDTGSNASRTWAEEASGNYFDAMGLQPYLGRFFHASDENGSNSAPYIVLTYAYWHSHFQADQGVVGRVVQLNKHPFTVIGVGPKDFHGTLLFFHPDFFTPIVNHPALAGEDLTTRGNRWVFMVMGHLKPGVTQAQAIADLNATGAYLEKNYSKDESKMQFKLGRPSLYGDYLGKPVREFMTGLTLLSGLILLAACANLGSLFAARAADRSREVALRLALGASRRRILRGLFTEAVLIALAGGALGLAGSVVLLHGLSVWQPIPRWPIQLAVNPDWRVYGFALLMALTSALLFGSVPVRQVLQTSPYEVVKAGSSARLGRRLTFRDVLLIVQIALCAVLVTSSMVALRGLARSLHGNFGFRVENAMLVDTDLSMAGYVGDKITPMQKRMIEAVGAIPGVESVALADQVPLGDTSNDTPIFTESTSDLKISNAAATPLLYRISPDYFRASGTTLLSGRSFTTQDDKDSPNVAIVNPVFARKIFGSTEKAIGGFFKTKDGVRTQVVGIVETGKYASLTEDPKPAIFIPLEQSPSSATSMIVRSVRDPQQLDAAIRIKLRDLDRGLPVFIQTRFKELDAMLFGPRMATLSLGVLGLMGAMLSITGIFGMAAYTVSKRLRELGIRIALGAQRREVLLAALARPLKFLAFGSAAGLLLGVLGGRVLAFIVSQATPRDPLVLGGVVLAMLLLGLVATWIPAQRALSVDPLALLREE